MTKRLGARAVLVGVLALTVGALFAGCGDSRSSSTSSGTATNQSAGTASTSKQPSGAPIKLMTIGPIEAPGFSLPSIPVGAQVAIDDLNKAGGLAGHPVELIVCNDKNDPITATSCARQAIQEKVAAVVGGLSGSDLKIVPYLKQAGIPWVGPSTPDAYQDDNLFLIGNEAVTGYVAIGESLSRMGCKKVAIVISAQGLPVSKDYIAAGVKADGQAEVVGSYKAPANGVDWAPIVSAATSAGADCVGAGTGPPETAGLIGAMKSADRKLKLVLLQGGMPDALVKQLGAAANGVYAAAAYLPFTDKSGVVQELKTKATTAAPKVPVDVFTESGYASVGVVADAAKGLDEVTAATLMEALPKVTGYDTGLGPVVDLTKPGAVSPAFPRLFNPNYYLWVARDGDTYLAEKEPVDTTAGLKLLAEKQ